MDAGHSANLSLGLGIFSERSGGRKRCDDKDRRRSADLDAKRAGAH